MIEAVAQKAGWHEQRVRDGRRGRGIAYSRYKNHACYVAVVADVEVDRDSGKVRVKKLFAAVDSGLIINSDGLRNQIEGGLIQTTSWTLREAVAFDRTRIQTRGWADYPVLNSRSAFACRPAPMATATASSVHSCQ